LEFLRLDKPQSKLDGIDDARRLQLLIDAIVDYAIYVIDVDGTVRSWNSGAERLKGYSASEIIGKSFSLFYSPEDRARGLPQTALKIAAEIGSFSGKGWRVRKDGGRFWALVVLDAIRDEQGQLFGFAKVTRDITERQQAHDELLESERRYRRLVEAVVDYAIFQLDPAGNVATWNPVHIVSKAMIQRRLLVSTSAGSIRPRTSRWAFRNGRFPRRRNTDASRPKAGECEKTAVAFGRLLSLIASATRLAISRDLRKSLAT
jgi:PAS domain S-box-containing protein